VQAREIGPSGILEDTDAYCFLRNSFARAR
jgi:hypothetical protein